MCVAAAFQLLKLGRAFYFLLVIIKPKGDNVSKPCVVLRRVSGGVLAVTSSYSDKLSFFFFFLIPSGC